MGGGWESFEVHARDTNIKGHSGEDSNRNEGHVIGNRRKGVLCHKMAKT